MISALPATPSDTANGAAAPPGDATGVAAAPTPFDFILTLETLAAQAASEQSAAASAGATLAGAGEFPGAEDGLETDDLDDDMDEGALEFLAGLLNAAAPRPAAAGAERPATRRP